MLQACYFSSIIWHIYISYIWLIYDYIWLCVLPASVSVLQYEYPVSMVIRITVSYCNRYTYTDSWLSLHEFIVTDRLRSASLEKLCVLCELVLPAKLHRPLQRPCSTPYVSRVVPGVVPGGVRWATAPLSQASSPPIGGNLWLFSERIWQNDVWKLHSHFSPSPHRKLQPLCWKIAGATPAKNTPVKKWQE